MYLRCCSCGHAHQLLRFVGLQRHLEFGGGQFFSKAWESGMYDSNCWMCSSEDQLPKPDCCLSHSFHITKNTWGQLKTWILYVWPGSRQGRWDRSALRATIEGTWSRVSGRNEVHTHSLHTEVQGCLSRCEGLRWLQCSQNQMQGKESKWPGEKHDVEEGTEGMRKPRNSSKLNTDILLLAWTVEVCPLLDS